MDFTEKMKHSETIFNGKMLTMKLDTVILPDGNEATREWIVHPGAVGVVAIDDSGRICLVRQHRYPTGKDLLEIPAGKLSPGEDPLECANRELEEETGLIAESWDKIYSYYTTPGFTDEIMHVYLATGLQAGEASPDEDEFLEVVMVTMEEAWDMMAKGEIQDGKTLIGLLHVFLNQGGR